MKRYRSSHGNFFARNGIVGHRVASKGNPRGGVRL